MHRFIKRYKNKKDYLVILIITIITTLIYFNSLGSPFVFDDLHMIEKNIFIKYLNKAFMVFLRYPTNIPLLRGMYRPLLMLSFAFNYYFSKLNPLGYHITNIMFHFLNGILIFLILKFFLKEKYFLPSLLSSLIFIVHPVCVESVTYISSRSTSMSCFFILLSLFLYIRKDDFDKLKSLYFYWGSLVAYIFAILTKEIAIVLPIILFSYDFIFCEIYKIKKLFLKLRYYVPLILITLAYLLLRRILFGSFANVVLARSIYSNILTQAHVSVFYMYLFILPIRLCLGRVFAEFNSIFEPPVIISFSIILLMFSLAIGRIRKSPVLTFSIFWFYINLIPKFIGTLSVLAAEHHLYIPMIGFIFLVAFILSNLFTFNRKNNILKFRKITTFIISFMIIVLLSIKTIKQNEIWKSPYSIWLNTVRISPSSAGAYNNLAVACLDLGKFEEGIRYIKIALKANPLPQREAIYRTTLATIYIEKKDFDLAIEELNKVTKLNPEIAEPYVNLGNAYSLKRQFDLALTQYKKAIEVNPQSFEAHLNLGLFYFQTEKVDLAIQEFKQALYLKPELYLIDYYLAKSYEKKNLLEEALRYYKTALGKFPGEETYTIHYDRGIVYGKIGKPEAIEEFNKALKLNPEYAPAHYNLAVSFAYLSPPKIELARKHLDLAIKYGYKPDEKFLSYLQELEGKEE